MRNLFIMAVAGLVATSAAHAGEMKWSGSADWRYDIANYDDQLGSVTNGQDASKQKLRQQEVRANLGVTGGWDSVEYGVDVRTTGANGAVANDDFSTLQGGKDLGIGFDQAWFRYVHDFSALDLSITLGRQKNVFAYDTTSQLFFDNDVRFDGLGWNFKVGSFGLNLGQYVLGAQNRGTDGASTYTKTDATQNAAGTQSHFNALYGFQPYMNWKFTDEVDAMFAVGYYSWIDNSNGNLSGGGYDSNTLNAAATAPTSTINGNNDISSPKQWQFLSVWNLPYNLTGHGELVLNKKEQYSNGTDVSHTAWTLGLTYGKVKKAHDWSIGYSYAKKGLGSVIDAYTYENFAADNKGHIIEAKYALADNLHLGVKALLLKEVGNVQLNGLAYTNAAQSEKTRYIELDAGVNF